MSPLARKYYMQFLKELAHAVVLAALFGGPLFYYLLVVMKP